MTPDPEHIRERMVKEQIMSRGVRDNELLAAMRKVPRHLFVEKENLRTAYGDHPLSIGCKQTISQPYIVAFMTEALLLKGEERVLEIGTGSGYQTAILAEIVKEVFTIEKVDALQEDAEKRLSELGYDNIRFKRGDGKPGWPEFAPYDGIIVTAAPEKLPEALPEQLRVGGRLVIPLGKSDQILMRYVRSEKGQASERLLSVRFVPLL